MKFCLILGLFCGVTVAELSWASEPLGDRYGHHYSQHKDTVSNARKGAMDRMQQLGVADDFGTLGGGSHSNLAASANPQLCTVPCDSSQFSTNDIGVYGAEHMGYPLSESSQSSKHSSLYQKNAAAAAAPIILPGGESSSKSSYSSSSRSERISQAAPIVIPVASDSERYLSHSDRFADRQSSGLSAPYAYPSSRYIGANSLDRASDLRANAISPQVSPSYKEEGEQFSSHRERASANQAAIPIRIHVRPSSSAQQYISQSERVSEHRAPLQIPVYSPSTSSERYSNRQEHERSQTIPFQVQAYPATSSSSSEHSSRSEKISKSSNIVPVPIPAVHPSSSSHYTSSDMERYYKSSGASPIVPIYTPSEKYFSENDHQQAMNQMRIAPVYQPSNSERSRYAASHDSLQESIAAQPIILPPRSSSSRYSNQESRSSSVSQQAYIPVPVIPSESSSRYSAQNELYKSNRNGAYIPVPYVSGSAAAGLAGHASMINHDDLDVGRVPSRLGSSVYHSDSDLTHFMTESERLAKEQAQSARDSTSGSSVVNADFSTGANSLDNRLASLGGGNGRFTKAKSWESNSKWSSGTQYDEHGKLKSYSSLSTGESEQHHANGKTVGYKAATSTLDDDGKVSTYSIHTP